MTFYGTLIAETSKKGLAARKGRGNRTLKRRVPANQAF